jgi:hypothetical protein
MEGLDVVRTFLDAKAMAISLRSSLAEQGIEVTHSRALEMVATQLGFRDWNTLAAEIGKDAGTEAISFSRAIPILRILSEEKRASSILTSSASPSIGSIGSNPACRSTCRYTDRT